MKWKAIPNAKYGTMYQCIRENSGWHIAFPRRAPEQPTVELRFGKRETGQLIPHMMDIGFFASAGEAMLAARMFDEGAVVPDSGAVRKGLGFEHYFDGGEKFDMAAGKRSVNQFLFLTGVGEGKRGTGLEYQGPGGRKGEHNIARLYSSSMRDPDFIPSVTADMAYDTEIAILMELLRIRMERGHGRHQEPMTVAEFSAWELARYGVEVDPDADRPYSLATPETRHAIASELLLGNVALQGRLGISPGFEERVTDKSAGMDDLLDNLVLANLRGQERQDFLDMLDGKVTEAELSPPAP